MNIQDSAVLKDKTMQNVKQSLERVSTIDNKDGFRVDMLEYINQSSYNNNDMFFYDMMEFIRFLKPDNEAVAYTTPNHLIFLNSPGHIGENVRQWDFIYDHECMHQLWETFGVEKKIKGELGKCDSFLLNIASDCVINDYLEHYRKKEMPDNLITPDFIEQKYGVVYDRKIDTQYTLYIKLLEVQEKLKKDMEKLLKMLGDLGIKPEQGDGSQGNGMSVPMPGGQSGDQSQQGGSSGGDQDGEGQDGKGNPSKGGKKSKGNKPGENGENGEKGNGKKPGENEGNGEGQDGEGKQKSGKGDKNGKSSSGDDGQDSEESSYAGGKGYGSDEQFEEDLEQIKKDAESIINAYAKKLSGVFGEYINKCKVAQQCKKDGLAVKVIKGNSSWNQDMSHYINAYVKNKIFKKKRQYVSTYSRVRRGSGPVKFGQPIYPGRKIVEETMDIQCAFYVDKSGSMDNCIQDVYKAVYRLAEAMKKQFSREKVVGKIDFDLFAFDDRLIKVKYGNSTNADGGTMSFDSLLENVNKHTKDYMINVIITDAGFSDVNEDKVNNFIDGLGGIILFITNVNNDKIKNIAKNKSDKLFYILADANFTVGDDKDK